MTEHTTTRNRLALERKVPKVPLRELSWGGGVTQPSVDAQKRAQKRMDGFNGRRVMELMMQSHPELARLSTRSLAERFAVCVITARRARAVMENRGMIPRTTVRQCRDGSEKDVSRIGPRGKRAGKVGGRVSAKGTGI